jgi:hypothetical protein
MSRSGRLAVVGAADDLRADGGSMVGMSDLAIIGYGLNAGQVPTDEELECSRQQVRALLRESSPPDTLMIG